MRSSLFPPDFPLPCPSFPSPPPSPSLPFFSVSAPPPPLTPPPPFYPTNKQIQIYFIFPLFLHKYSFAFCFLHLKMYPEIVHTSSQSTLVPQALIQLYNKALYCCVIIYSIILLGVILIIKNYFFKYFLQKQTQLNGFSHTEHTRVTSTQVKKQIIVSTPKAPLCFLPATVHLSPIPVVTNYYPTSKSKDQFHLFSFLISMEFFYTICIQLCLPPTQHYIVRIIYVLCTPGLLIYSILFIYLFILLLMCN